MTDRFGDLRLLLMKAPQIVRLRKRLGLTQAKFAKQFGVTQATVSKWELGQVRPGGSAEEMLQSAEDAADTEKKTVKIVIRGRPKTGKSSLAVALGAYLEANDFEVRYSVSVEARLIGARPFYGAPAERRIIVISEESERKPR